MKLYLGGKMIGVPGYGFQNFDEAAVQLRAQGHEVFNPAERDRASGFDPGTATGTLTDLDAKGFDRRRALAADLAWIMAESEGMVALTNWTDSPGARAEVAAHQGLYLPVWELPDFLELGTVAPVLLDLAPAGKIFVDGDLLL